MTSFYLLTALDLTRNVDGAIARRRRIRRSTATYSPALGEAMGLLHALAG